jgi:hypothetical protein
MQKKKHKQILSQHKISEFSLQVTHKVKYETLEWNYILNQLTLK